MARTTPRPHPLTRFIVPACSRIGHRGAYLIFLAVLDAAYGSSLLSEPPAQFERIDTFVPVIVWGWLWVAVGVVCAIQAPMCRDRVAFSAASGMKIAWAGVYAEGWLVHHLYRGWITMVVWATFAITTLIIASWPEPDPFRR